MSETTEDKIELAKTATGPAPDFAADRRPRVPEPLPVRLIAVDHLHAVAPAGLEADLDAFYVNLLGFEREAGSPPIVYRAENFRLMIDVVEVPDARQGMRPIGIEVHSLFTAEHKLVDAEIEYMRQRAITPGRESLLLRDPAGNWVELQEAATIR